MREVLSFAQKPRRAASFRGVVLVVDATIHEVLVEERDSARRSSAVVDPRDLSEALHRIVAARDGALWIECEVSGGVVTQFHLVADDAGVAAALRAGNWSIEEDAIVLCRSVWRDARVPYRRRDPDAPPPPSSPPQWRDEVPLFPHQRRTVDWMLGMEAAFPRALPYDGNLKITDEWYVDTDAECFTTDPGRREAHVRGGICADGMGKGKTASALRLIVEGGLADSRRATGGYESRATLVILPVNLVGQWRREMEKFLRTDGMRILFVVQGRQIPSMREVLEADVVVTTFHFLKSNKTYVDLVERCLRGRSRERASLSAWARVPGQEQCLLEAVTWRRVIIDEMHHAFERIGDLKHVRLLSARALWGLTATPVLDNDRAQHLYAMLTREEAHHPNLLARLIGTCVRAGPHTDRPEAGSRRAVCLTSLSAEERILLRGADRDDDTLAEKVRSVTLVDRARGGDAALESELAIGRRRECDAMRARVDGYERSVRLLEGVSKELARERDELRRGADAERARAAEAACESHDRDLAAARGMLCRQRVRLQEMQAAAEAERQRVRTMRDEASCEICGVVGSESDRVCILSGCLHILCAACVGARRDCAVCGEAIADTFAVEAARGVGTKMREIASLIHGLGEAEPCILFVQWKSMVRGSRCFLRSLGVTVHTLDGTPTQRVNTLLAFGSGGVLLLSLDDGFAGLHLPHVSHVIFAHAIVGDLDRVRTLESQAIARCVRYGQTRDVRTFSFVVADTEEHALYDRTHDERGPAFRAAGR